MASKSVSVTCYGCRRRPKASQGVADTSKAVPEGPGHVQQPSRTAWRRPSMSWTAVGEPEEIHSRTLYGCWGRPRDVPEHPSGSRRRWRGSQSSHTRSTVACGRRGRSQKTHRSCWIDTTDFLTCAGAAGLTKNVLETPRGIWINKNSVLEVRRSRWIDENSVLDCPRSR